MIHPRRWATVAWALIAPALLMLVRTRPLDASPDGATYDPTSGYEVRRVEGWTVLVNRKFLGGRSELADRALALLGRKLGEVARRLPSKAVDRLRTIRIWVEEDEPHNPCMAYHPDPGWLRDRGMNPEKARCVELANARNFLAWSAEQPWMVLHELAHGYHHQAVPGGFENKEIAAAFEGATRAGLYASVRRANGKRGRAYAATNPMEYFAESSEAFFGTNDFYPFDRAGLREHDPAMSALVEKLWEETPPGPLP